MLPEKTLKPSSCIVELGAVKCPPGSPAVGPVIVKVCPKSGSMIPLSVTADVVVHVSGEEEVCVKQPAVLNSESLKVTLLTHGGGGGGGGWFDEGATTLMVLVTVVVWVGLLLSPPRLSVTRTRTVCGPVVVNV